MAGSNMEKTLTKQTPREIQFRPPISGAMISQTNAKTSAKAMAKSIFIVLIFILLHFCEDKQFIDFRYL